MRGKKTTKKLSDQPGRPAPSEKELERIKLAADRRLARQRPVSMAWDSAGFMDAAHSEKALAFVAIADALGTTSIDFRSVQLAMLDYAARERGEDRGKSAAGLNASLALVEAIAPQNELEAALAVQMAGVHNLTGELLGRAKQTDRADHIALFGGLAVKLARTFAAQVEALAKLRGGGKQQVEVRHVYVNGTAVIGDVHAGGGGGGDAENSDRPRTQALAHLPGAPVPPMWSADPQRDAMPVAGGAGAEEMQNARRNVAGGEDGRG